MAFARKITQPLSVVQYYGGKYQMAKLLADTLDYTYSSVYIEAFGGGARTLLNKRPHGQEIYYELQNGMYSLFKALSDADKAKELIERLYQIDCNEDTFTDCRKKLDLLEESATVDDKDLIDAAVNTYVVYTTGRDGMGKRYANRYKYPYSGFQKTIYKLQEASERLSGVDVRHGDSIEFIKSVVDDKKVMMYLDPPYLQAKEVVNTRITEGKKLPKTQYNPGKHYKNGDAWTKSKHEDFLEIIKDAGSRILVSNYTDPDNTYDSYLTRERGWKKLEYETTTTIGSSGSRHRVECLWYNY